MHLIWFEVVIVLKGMFKIKLAFLFAFKRVNFARQAFLDTFLYPPNFLCSFYAHHTKSVATPALEH